MSKNYTNESAGDARYTGYFMSTGLDKHSKCF